jgi:succinate dehydrogenase/fumarate reductase flavoprotein subunit
MYVCETKSVEDNMMKKIWKPLAGLIVLLLGLSLIAGCENGMTDQVQQIDKTYETDVVVVGGGGAGFSAALAARLAGKEVIILEQLAYTGGNSVLAGGALNAAFTDDNFKTSGAAGWRTMSEPEKTLVEEKITMDASSPSYAHLNLTDTAKINTAMKPWQDKLKEHWNKWKAAGEIDFFDSPYLHILQTYEAGDFIAKPELVQTFGENVVDAWKWLGEQGGTINTDSAPGLLVGSLWYRSHGVQFTGGVDGGGGGSGVGFIRPQEAKFVAEGGVRLLEHQAHKIVMDNGRAVGIVGTFPGGVFEVKAKAVVMTTGGFGGNWEMLEQYQPGQMANYNPNQQEKKWDNIKNYSTTNSIPAATGEGMRMAAAAGANLYQMDQIQLLPGSNTAPGVALTDTMYVNELGQRIVNETGRRDELSLSFIAQEKRPKGSSWTVTGDSLRPPGPGFTLPGLIQIPAGPHDDVEDLGTAILTANGTMSAENLAVFVTNFNAAVKDYNDAFDAGIADSVGKLVKSGKLEAPWWVGSVQRPYVHHTMGGIEINAKAEVLSTGGEVIPGLYAAGECVGGLHGSNRIGGNAVGDIIVFGRIAGQSAAAYAK